MKVQLTYGITSGAATTVVISEAVSYLARNFTPYQSIAPFGIKNNILLGVIGAIQVVSSVVILTILMKKFKRKTGKYFILGIIGTNILTSGVLVGLTALAFKVNLIASKLNLLGGGLLIISSMSSLFIALHFHIKRQKKTR